MKGHKKKGNFLFTGNSLILFLLLLDYFRASASSAPALNLATFFAGI